MRQLLLAALVLVLSTPAAFAQPHSIGPERQDRWSVCIQPWCLDVEWVARIAVTILSPRSGVFYAELTCRPEDGGRDHLITSGVGERYISIIGQILPTYYRWCNVFVRNYDDIWHDYEMYVVAEPEGDPPTQLWPNQKRTTPVP